jgi:hypothetical protein
VASFHLGATFVAATKQKQLGDLLQQMDRFMAEGVGGATADD